MEKSSRLFLITLVTLITFYPDSIGGIAIELSSNWVLVNNEFDILIPNVTIPNSVHSILESQSLINEPLYRYNDVSFRWIVYADNWILKNEFSWDTQTQTSVSLTLNSIDTFASVYLNGVFLMNTSNQFIEYEYPHLNKYLNTGANVLELRFESSVKKARDMAANYPYRVPPTCVPKVQHGECQVNFLRKQQCSFSWDWGPAFAPIGINGPVRLNFFNETNNFDFDFSVNVYPLESPNNFSNWALNIDLRLNQTSTFSNFVLLEVKIDTIGYISNRNLTVSDQNAYIKTQFTIKNDNQIKLWWPSGYGQQPLYNLKVSVSLPDGSKSIVKSKRIGFRSVVLVQQPIENEMKINLLSFIIDFGLTFYFTINQQPIFLKGSNWIPADSFQEKISQSKLAWLLNSAKLANMNVLRVWGGGVYEKDEFYDLADEMGIMIWQDFMFACGAYPTNKDFLDNVAYETWYQVNRLKHHPSIIVWAGNNENEAAISTNWYNTDVDRPR